MVSLDIIYLSNTTYRSLNGFGRLLVIERSNLGVNKLANLHTNIPVGFSHATGIIEEYRTYLILPNLSSFIILNLNAFRTGIEPVKNILYVLYPRVL